MGIISNIQRFFGYGATKYKMVTDNGGGFYTWNGKLYQSDIVRSCIRPKARAIGKAKGKHIRDRDGTMTVNPEAYIRFLLEEPNMYMTGQQLQEKLITQLELNNNAFAWIERDENGIPVAIYPINCCGVELVVNKGPMLRLKFYLINGKNMELAYEDVIHLRKDFSEDDFFGSPLADTIAPLMEIVNTTDQGIVKAIKNSSVIKWLLKFTTSLRPEDLKEQARNFSEGFMSQNSDTGGVAATDSKADAQQVEYHDYVPNASQMDRTTKRIMSIFNTNEKIIQSNYNENEWISYYEAAVEPDLIQLSDEFTRKLFNRKERGFGNRIIFEPANLTFASMSTKLALTQMVDRALMTRNEVRKILGYAPVPGGDEFLLRKDTASTNGKGGEKE